MKELKERREDGDYIVKASKNIRKRSDCLTIVFCNIVIGFQVANSSIPSSCYNNNNNSINNQLIIIIFIISYLQAKHYQQLYERFSQMSGQLLQHLLLKKRELMNKKRVKVKGKINTVLSFYCKAIIINHGIQNNNFCNSNHQCKKGCGNHNPSYY